MTGKKTKLFLRKYRITPVKSSRVLGGAGLRAVLTVAAFASLA